VGKYEERRKRLLTFLEEKASGSTFNIKSKVLGDVLATNENCMKLMHITSGTDTSSFNANINSLAAVLSLLGWDSNGDHKGKFHFV
jgi:hypothetical protein